jgi:hypothetical protein
MIELVRDLVLILLLVVACMLAQPRRHGPPVIVAHALCLGACR